jgi:molybdate transport system substrate-binding protein
LMNKRLSAVVFVTMVLATSAGMAEQQKELTVFAAASLTGAFGEIGQMFENETNISVLFNFDGSQVLRTQIENGAYADVFASANTKQVNALKNAGLMNNSSISFFAKNKLSLIVPKDNPAKINNLTDLSKPGTKIVIGTKDVPVGDYAMQIINKLGNDSAFGPDYEKKVMANIISQETNVNYVVTKVALGEADVGFAYVSDITEELAAKVNKIEILDEYNIVAKYPVGILKESKYPAEAEEFINLVKSDKGKSILNTYGFMSVEGTSTPARTAATVTATKASA